MLDIELIGERASTKIVETLGYKCLAEDVSVELLKSSSDKTLTPRDSALSSLLPALSPAKT
jgi:hypothetical protein